MRSAIRENTSVNSAKARFPFIINTFLKTKDVRTYITNFKKIAFGLKSDLKKLMKNAF